MLIPVNWCNFLSWMNKIFIWTEIFKDNPTVYIWSCAMIPTIFWWFPGYKAQRSVSQGWNQSNLSVRYGIDIFHLETPNLSEVWPCWQVYVLLIDMSNLNWCFRLIFLMQIMIPASHRWNEMYIQMNDLYKIGVLFANGQSLVFLVL